MAFYDFDDLDVFFADFADTVTLSGGSTIEAMVDDAQEYVDSITGEVITTEPSITAKTRDVTTLFRGSTVTINGVTWNILDKRSDRTGISILRISKQ